MILRSCKEQSGGKSTLGYEWSHGQFWPCFGKNHINRENIKKGKTRGIHISSLLIWMKNHKLEIALFL